MSLKGQVKHGRNQVDMLYSLQVIREACFSCTGRVIGKLYYLDILLGIVPMVELALLRCLGV